MDRADWEFVGLVALMIVHIVAAVVVVVAMWVFLHNFSWCRFGYLVSSFAFMVLSFEAVEKEKLGGAVFSIALSVVFALVVIYGL